MVIPPVHQVWPDYLARHSERGKKTRQTEEEVGRQHQEMGRPGVRQVPEGSKEQRKMEETGCEIICGAPTTFAVKGLTMMMMMMMNQENHIRTKTSFMTSQVNVFLIDHDRSLYVKKTPQQQQKNRKDTS